MLQVEGREGLIENPLTTVPSSHPPRPHRTPTSSLTRGQLLILTTTSKHQCIVLQSLVQIIFPLPLVSSRHVGWQGTDIHTRPPHSKGTTSLSPSSSSCSSLLPIIALCSCVQLSRSLLRAPLRTATARAPLRRRFATAVTTTKATEAPVVASGTSTEPGTSTFTHTLTHTSHSS